MATMSFVSHSTPLLNDHELTSRLEKLLNQLDGPERESFIEVMEPQFAALRKMVTGKQIAAIDRLMSAARSPVPSKPGSTSASSAPATPGLQVDVNSAAPTPVLTMEPNSPQSSSPPSTDASAAGDAADDGAKVKVGGGKEDPSFPAVRVQEV
jgi:mRNA-binding protein PUF3